MCVNDSSDDVKNCYIYKSIYGCILHFIYVDNALSLEHANILCMSYNYAYANMNTVNEYLTPEAKLY